MTWFKHENAADVKPWLPRLGLIRFVTFTHVLLKSSYHSAGSIAHGRRTEAPGVVPTELPALSQHQEQAKPWTVLYVRIQPNLWITAPDDVTCGKELSADPSQYTYSDWRHNNWQLMFKPLLTEVVCYAAKESQKPFSILLRDPSRNQFLFV
jgi:hypothetical protein